MPKKKGKGGKKYKRGKKDVNVVRDLIFKEEGQQYATVDKMLGDCRTLLICEDGKNRLGIIRGAMKKKEWIQPGDLVLVSLRTFQDDKLDIIHKYNDEEMRKLKKKGYLSGLFENRKYSGECCVDEHADADEDQNEDFPFVFEEI
jgi:translation initiation factor 1A